MFVEASDRLESTYSADVAIVGAGAAGITVAQELQRAGRTVVLIESGGHTISQSTQSLNRAETAGLRTFSAPASRFRCFGGSTARWGGQCRPLDAIDFDESQNQSAVGWPFALADIEPYYRRAVEFCNLERSYDDTLWLAARANDSLDKVTYQFSHPRHFGENFEPEFLDCPTMRVLLNSTITHIQLNKGGNRVACLCARRDSGEETQIIAESVVLACGGIDNPRLLLAANDVAKNGIGNSNDLVGRYFNDHPYAFIGEIRATDKGARAISEEMTLHDYDGVGVDQKSLLALTMNDGSLIRDGLNKCAMYFIRRASYKSKADYFSSAGVSFNYIVDLLRRTETLDRPLSPEIGDVLKGIPSILATAARAARHIVRPENSFAARVVMTATPNSRSRVTLSKDVDRYGMPLPKIDWQLHRSDRKGLTALMASAKDYFDGHGLGRLVEIPWNEKTGWPSGMTGGKHHMGTTRMHLEPDLGVVNADGRVHEVDNLYVAGSSVFPTGGYANPTLTIVALAIRLADHLKAL